MPAHTQVLLGHHRRDSSLHEQQPKSIQQFSSLRNGCCVGSLMGDSKINPDILFFRVRPLGRGRIEVKTMLLNRCAPLLFSCISILFGAIAAQSQEKKSAKTHMDAVTVAAYQKLGAEYGGWVKSGFVRFFQAGRDSAEKGVPGFRFRNFPKSKLPKVAVPFGLDLSGSNVNQARLKELAALKNLAVLDLRHTKVTDRELKELAGLENLTSLNLCHVQVTDAGLKDVATLKNLATLNLLGTQVTDAGLKEVAVLKCLASLYLNDTQVTDEGLKELASLKNLAVLGLSQTRLTDAGMEQLVSLKNLALLYVGSTKVTEAGIAKLRQALPNCMIVR